MIKEMIIMMQPEKRETVKMSRQQWHKVVEVN